MTQVLAPSPFQQTELANIKIPSPERTLFMIGNGFDLTHGVKSRYLDFKNFLGNRNPLKETLEYWIRDESLWSDFETALAHIDADGMLTTVDSWMEDLDVKDPDDPDFSAADFFLAQEAAAGPAISIMEDLPRYFRRWVNGLTAKGTKRPLSGLLHPQSRYINFNYTEFLESLYGIPVNRILYIHGYRRNKQQELVLGHAPGQEDIVETDDREPYFRGQAHYDAYQGTMLHLNHYYDATTKKCSDIIQRKKPYFTALNNITDIVVIGHSMSGVDYQYYREIIHQNIAPQNIKWKLSWHDAKDDMKKIANFVDAMRIEYNQIELFEL